MGAVVPFIPHIISGVSAIMGHRENKKRTALAREQANAQQPQQNTVDYGTKPLPIAPEKPATATPVAEVKERVRKRERGRGRASTILTSGAGVTSPSTTSSVAVKKLLGQ